MRTQKITLLHNSVQDEATGDAIGLFPKSTDTICSIIPDLSNSYN